MAKIFDHLDDKLIAFIKRQHMYFVATAPLSPDGHVNLSPKGYDSFAIIDPTTVAFLDMGGSGIETVAHVRENGRITIMFCAFEGAPNILRLYGEGRSTAMDSPDYPALLALFPGKPQARAARPTASSAVRAHATCTRPAGGWGGRRPASAAPASCQGCHGGSEDSVSWLEEDCVDWLVDWLVDWPVDWLVDSVDWLDWLDWLEDSEEDWL